MTPLLVYEGDFRFEPSRIITSIQFNGQYISRVVVEGGGLLSASTDDQTACVIQKMDDRCVIQSYEYHLGTCDS
jgi:hypothetical protein